MDLRQARIFMGWSQIELSKRLGITQPLINMWEHGKVSIPTKRQQQLEELFGVPVTFEKENQNMNSQAFENGRRRALQQIEEKLAAARGDDSSLVKQSFTNQRLAAPARSSRERLGFGNVEAERGREQQALENAVRAGRIQNRTNLPSGGQPVARASDSFPGMIPTPADIRTAMERNSQARAELHRVTIENRQAAQRRLGLGNRRSALAERLAKLLEDGD